MPTPSEEIQALERRVQRQLSDLDRAYDRRTTRMEEDIRGATQKLDKVADKLDRKLDGVVTKATCEAVQSTQQEALKGVTASVTTLNRTVTDGLRQLEAQAKTYTNGKVQAVEKGLEDSVKIMVPKAQDKSQEKVPLLERMGKAATHIKAIIALLLMAFTCFAFLVIFIVSMKGQMTELNTRVYRQTVQAEHAARVAQQTAAEAKSTAIKGTKLLKKVLEEPEERTAAPAARGSNHIGY